MPIHSQYLCLWLCLERLSLVPSEIIYGFSLVPLSLNLISLFLLRLDQYGNKILTQLYFDDLSLFLLIEE